MNSKFALALIALVGVGVFALPSTMALFAGQHSFYNIDSTGNQIPCQKCHGDVKSELKSNSISNVVDKPDSPGPHANFKCEYCHRAEAGYASGDNAYGLIIYSDGTNYRYLAMTVYDFEAKNFPEEINGADVFPNPVAGGTTTYGTTLAGATFKSNAVLSATSGTGTFTVYSEKLNPTFSRVNGDPLDTIEASRYGGLNISAIRGFKGSSRSATADLNYSGSKAVNPGTAYHAASLVSCMECHRGAEPFGHYSRLAENGTAECSNCHYGTPHGAAPAGWTDLAAGGFNLTSDAADTGVAEAHDEFTKDNTNGILRYKYNTSNAACVGCHTHVAVDINFTKRYMLSFDATGLETGTWNIDNYKASGTVAINTFGNASGETFAVGNHSYTWPTVSDSMPTLYTSDGTPVTGLDNAANDSKEALTGP